MQNYLNFKVSKKLTFVLSYLGKTSCYLRTGLRETTEIDLPFCKLKVMLRFKSRRNFLYRS